MKQLPLVEIGSPEKWAAHLSARVKQAFESHLLKNDIVIDVSSSSVFVPEYFSNNNALAADPNSDLSEATGVSATPQPGWVKRHDLFDEIARWLCNFDSPTRKVMWLMCEAGYSRIGDPVLEKRPHTIVNNRPLFIINVVASNHEALSKTLKWGRSDRFLGVLQEGNVPEAPLPATRGFFLCDAFDGDSLIFSRFNAP